MTTGGGSVGGPISFEDHQRWAVDTQAAEKFIRQYNLPPSAVRTVGGKAQLLISVPRYSETDLLVGTKGFGKTYASLTAPPNYFTQVFQSSTIAPSLGSPEKQEANVLKLNAISSDNPRLEEKAQQIINMQVIVIKDNEEIMDARTKMLQFVQA